MDTTPPAVPLITRVGVPAVPSCTPHAVFAWCPMCDGVLTAEHAHYRCTECGWRDSCCD